ncbi:hypothetical protein MASR2M117_19850 [Paludibacter sp.]
MKTIIFEKKTIRFRQWSRKAYAVFASLGKLISIGKLKKDVAVKSLNNGIESLSQIFSLVFLFAAGANVSAVELTDTTAILLDELQVSAVQDIQFPGAGKSLQIFTAEDIKKSPVPTLDAFLKLIPGVDIRQRGSNGSQADISIRGGSFDQVLVLLNGVDITDKQTGHHNLNIPLDISEISKIEVLQGSAARKFAHQAFSGAINIITNPREKSKIDATLSAGSFDTYSQRLSLSYSNQKIANFTTISHSSSNGFRPNTDYETYNLFSQTNYSHKNIGNFDFQLGYQNKSFGANGFYALAYPNQFEHTETVFYSLNWKKSIYNLFLSANLNYRKNYDRFELFRNFKNAANWYVDHNYHLSDISGATFDLDYIGALGKISSGVSVRNDHIFSTVLGNIIENEGERPINIFEKGEKRFTKSAERLVSTAYVDFSKAMGSLYLSAGGTLSQSQQFGLMFNWGANLSYLPMTNMVIKTFIGTASRLPTFTDLYYQSATQVANPNLYPESSLSAEMNINYELNRLQFNVNSFYRKGTNIIDWIKYPNQVKWESMNLGELDTYGYSVAAKYRFSKKKADQVALSYTFINTDKLAVGYDSKYALDYLRHQLILNINHSVIRNTTLTWNLMMNDRAGEYSDFVTGAIKPYQPYFLAGARFAWEKSGFQVYTDVNNILNSRYVDFGGLPLPGVNVNVGVKWRLRKD